LPIEECPELLLEECPELWPEVRNPEFPE